MYKVKIFRVKVVEEEGSKPVTKWDIKKAVKMWLNGDSEFRYDEINAVGEDSGEAV